MSSQHTVSIDLGSRSYPIYIGQGLLKQPEQWLSHIKAKQLLLVSNTTIAPLYADTLAQQLGDRQVAHCYLPDGEAHKNWQTLNTVFDALLQHNFDRGCCIIALGGGVIGDMAGFAAASYQRGVSFVQIPTTLLAQVDSSVGGKTGINHPAGKNMIGAFHQPQCVVADIDTLSTLPQRELAAGLAEVIKYGLLWDSAFFDWLEQNLPALLARDPQALSHAIRRSCEIKAEIVAQDEREGGVRALLNLGHTFGHAIESALGYGEWLHGEAVGVGMLMAADLSQRLGLIGQADYDRAAKLISDAGLPLSLPEKLSAAELLGFMQHDKKVQNARVRLILMRQIGQTFISSDYDDAQLNACLEHFCP